MEQFQFIWKFMKCTNVLYEKKFTYAFLCITFIIMIIIIIIIKEVILKVMDRISKHHFPMLI